MRVLNQRAVLELLRRAGPATRPQVAKGTGLSKPTVGQALLGLEQAGLVRPAGRTSAGPGRSAVVYEANPAAGYVLGVDIGRERIRIALTDLGGFEVARCDERNRCRSASALVRLVRELADRTVSSVGIRFDEVVAKVVGSPGVADRNNRALQLAPNLPGWGRKGLLDELEASLGPGLIVENDANLAALGEQRLGAARDARVFVLVTVGTGVGMGIVMDGQLFRGAHGTAGEIGYLPFGPFDEQALLAGQLERPARGLLEQVAAAEPVVALAHELGLADVRTAKDVFDAAREGDEVAAKVVERIAVRLAYGVASVTAVIDPELVVLSGGIGRNGELLIEPMNRALAYFSPLVPTVVAGELGDGAVLAGALTIGLRVAEDTVFDRHVHTG
ncbi:putative NBD/HSP70 family sugar kinase [Crossiella equi]|uniref:NBD/HSP70 family sugar kinase n=1 Tax=Crossiella equi TaxID=130796 RepID=A0ABS5AFG5_9PSEU|nr:ROK family transcriptional regulator [Crossiella equi]MBP2474415.1 putative NBD/HSP70 family sugar kinase [Crossiella equi]